MKFKVSAKSNNKWRIFGQIKEGKFGPNLSFRNTQELRDFINSAGDWVNFSLFPDDDKSKEIDGDTQIRLDNLKASVLDAEIPF